MKQEGKLIQKEESWGAYKLPEGWRWVRLGDLVKEDRNQINPLDQPEKKFWLLTMDCVESNSGKLIQQVEIQGYQIKSAKFVFNKNHILYGKLRPYLNKVFTTNMEDGICTTEFIPLLPKERVDKLYLAYFLRTPSVVKYAMSNLSGARQPRVDLGAFYKMQIPLPFLNGAPDIEAQKRIVARIEALFEKLDRAKELRKQAEKEAQELLQAALHQVFAGAEEKGWRWVRLEEITKIIMGQSPPSETYNNAGEGLPFYQGKVDFGDLHPNPRIYCISPNRTAEPNDILISVRAPVGPVNIASQRCGIGRGLAAIRPKDAQVFYVFYWLKYLEDKWNVGGTTFGAIKKDDLINLKLPLPFRNGNPDLEEQKRIAAYLDKIAEKQKALLKLYEETEKDIEEMKQALLNRAFRGEL